jgi:hypothetical protein
VLTKLKVLVCQVQREQHILEKLTDCSDLAGLGNIQDLMTSSDLTTSKSMLPTPPTGRISLIAPDIQVE